MTDKIAPTVYINKTCDLEAFCALFIIEFVHFESRVSFLDASHLQGITRSSYDIFLGYPMDITKSANVGPSTTARELFIKYFNTVHVSKVGEQHTLLDFEKKIRNANNLYALICYCNSCQTTPGKSNIDSQDSLADCMFWLSDCLPIEELYNIFAYVANIALCDKSILSNCKDYIINKFPETKEFFGVPAPKSA